MRVVAFFTLLYLPLAGHGVHLAVQQQRQVLGLSAQTTATILEKRLEVSSRRRREFRFSYQPVVRFQFRAQDRQFTSDNLFPETPFSGLAYGGNIAWFWAKLTLAGFRPGQETTAYYNPADPRTACLIRRPSALPYLIILLPLTVVSGFLAYFWRSSRAEANDFKLMKARVIAVAWHSIGFASAAHYFYVAGTHFGASGLMLFSGFTLLGLIPVSIGRNRKTSPNFQ